MSIPVLLGLRTASGRKGVNFFLYLGVLLLPCNALAVTHRPTSNWIGQFEPCTRSAELVKHGHMDLGVRINTADPTLGWEFRRAMNFWAKVLDLTWHEENSIQCSIQVLDGSPDLFLNNNATAARSQFVDRPNFHGWIAFNPKCRLNESEMYLAAIHEIGHMLGLSHNRNPKSVMYFLDPEGPATLDRKDVALLASRHKLRE